ncbi:hypothetical protein V490_08887 [Pseudogymnoascus sp. VKM F-3557]|nr:hypothetical protein V490_08887 [Pseudogymnoascus sp. VKM F-3557]
MFLFNNLPPELRARIWRFTVEPRTVEIDLTEREWMTEKKGCLLYSTTPVPAPLHTCREARSLGLYKQAFSEVCPEQRYVWVNLDIDMISIGSKTHLSYFGAIAPLIKRLKFQREHQDEWWFRNESKLVKTFINVEEIHVMCDSWYNWWGGSEDIRWPCAMENVLLFEEEDGPAMNPIELDKMWYDRQEVEERELQAEYDEDTRLELADMVPL